VFIDFPHNWEGSVLRGRLCACTRAVLQLLCATGIECGWCSGRNVPLGGCVLRRDRDMCLVSGCRVLIGMVR
jgi:hypothetical protein